MYDWISRMLGRLRDDGARQRYEEMEALDVEELLAEMHVAPSKSVSSKLRKARRAPASLPAPRTDRSTERLPPGQVLTENWPILDIGIRPEIDRADWSLELTGAVEHPLSIDWEAFVTMPADEWLADIHCVTGWSRFDDRWSGVPASVLVEAARPSPRARAVMLHGADGYTTNLPIADFLHPGAMVVHSWNGEPLGSEHGGPVRLIVPHLYLWKSAKWLTRIAFLEEDEPGFWEKGGYHRRGDPWLEQRFRWNDVGN